MSRTFIKNALIVFLALFTAVNVIFFIGTRRIADDLESRDPPLVPEFRRLVAHHLAERAPVDLDAEARELRSILHVPVTVVPLGENEEREHPRMQKNPFFVVEVPDAGRALRIGSVTPLPPPPPGDWTLAMTLGMVVVVVGLTGLWLTVPMVRRLRRLERAALSVSRGELDVRLPVNHKDDLGSLERHFNSMAAWVKELLERQQHIVQAVAHDVRTPISCAKFTIERLRTADDPERAALMLAELDQDLDEINQLASELLVFCRYDNQRSEMNFEQSAMAPIVERVIEQFKPLNPEVTIVIELPAREELTAVVDTRAFERALQNLVSTAVRYARTEVVVSCRRLETGFAVEVSDDGPGIPISERENVLEPFVRLEESRSRASGGAGLGLAIVNKIIERHQGSIEIGESPAGGARFITIWPT
jgi:two-component system, OmpR family, sensor histidine kinase RstB